MLHAYAGVLKILSLMRLVLHFIALAATPSWRHMESHCPDNCSTLWHMHSHTWQDYSAYVLRRIREACKQFLKTIGGVNATRPVNCDNVVTVHRPGCNHVCEFPLVSNVGTQVQWTLWRDVCHRVDKGILRYILTRVGNGYRGIVTGFWGSSS